MLLAEYVVYCLAHSKLVNTFRRLLDFLLWSLFLFLHLASSMTWQSWCFFRLNKRLWLFRKWNISVVLRRYIKALIPQELCALIFAVKATHQNASISTLIVCLNVLLFQRLSSLVFKVLTPLISSNPIIDVLKLILHLLHLLEHTISLSLLLLPLLLLLSLFSFPFLF